MAQIDRSTRFARFVRTYDQLREIAPTLTADQIAELKGILNNALSPEAFALQRAAERFGTDGLNLGPRRRPAALSAENGFSPSSDFGMRAPA